MTKRDGYIGYTSHSLNLFVITILRFILLFTEPNAEAQLYINQLLADGNTIPVDEDASFEVELPSWFDPDKFKRYFFF